MFPSKFTFHRSISFLLVFTFCLISTLNAQQSIGGEPYSFLYPDVFSSKQLSAIQINTPDLQLIQAEDIQRDRQGKYTRYAVWENVSIDLNNSGEWTELPNGDRVWRLQITGKKALALNLLYDNFYLPTDSRFFIYNAAQTHVLGAFSSLNNKESGVFASANVRGETSILEYYEPAAVRGEGIISIEKVGYVYRFVDHPLAKNSEPCEVDVNCSEGNNWQDEKRGVVRISVVAPDGAGWCSGSLINNTGQDCKAYILTALHCGETSTTANFNQYIFYFNYESSGCAVNDASDNQSITGCVKRADSNDGGGNTGSDYMLVELNNSIPSNYNVYYNGWNAANTASGSGVSIHHPAGDRKKISTYSSVLISSSWQNVPNTHWEVQWVETANGHGVTEGGSSGSAIFDNTGRIVGQLTGGGSFCDDTDATDLYGKMSYNWTSNANGDDLKTWLDPTNSGVLQLAGSNNPCAGGGNPTCSDGMMNGDETGVDCGGSTCDPCTTDPTCNDGMMNGNETGVDCGGPDCEPCATDPTCNDGMMNGNETGVDCGGPDCRPCSSGCETMTLVINFDDYPDETYWEILQNGDIIESDGPYDELDPMVTSITKTMCLSNGCYEFIIYDDAEDGICCGDFGDGNYTLTNSSNQVMAQGGQFEDEESTNFCASAAAALPLSWLSFNVTQQSDAVYLTWETAAEINNTGFEIERSKDGNDWKNIGWQAASTASTRNATYSFVDAEPLSGLSYYRLAQIDQDGQQTWSEVRQARFSNVVSELKVYPNPLTTNQLSIDLPSSEIPATAIFTDQLGRVVQQTSLASGQQSLLLQNLPQGVYWLQVEQAGEVWMEKIVKY